MKADFIDADTALSERRLGQARPRAALSLPAWAFLVLIAAVALFLSWLAFADVRPLQPKEWVAFALLAVGAALAQLFPVVTPRDQSYHTTMVVLVPAALLLPTWLLPVVVLAQHLPEWLRVRYPWYIQTFNASNYLVDLFAAAAVGRYLLRDDGLIGNDELRFAVAGLAAALVLVVLNHLILSVMLRLARGHSLTRVRPVLLRQPRDRPRARGARRARGVRLADQPGADPVRGRAPAPDPPFARGAAARAGGPARPEDRPLQRALLQHRAEREAGGIGADGTASRAADDRSRPAARDQQHPRPPRRRRDPGADRRRLPQQPAGGRHRGALRRRGIRAAPAGHRARATRSPWQSASARRSVASA